MTPAPGRILTTHAGSLPRPAELVELFVRRSNGEAIGQEQFDRTVEAATRWVVPKQREAGIDIPNNGEQPREAFFLYVRHRMSGFADGGTRRGPADVERYPKFLEARRRMAQAQAQTSVSNFAVPRVVDEVAYLNPELIERECADFRRILSDTTPEATQAFITAPSPGIIAAAVPNEHYDSRQAYLDALAEALRTEYEAIVAQGFVLQIDAPDLALERHVTFAERPLAEFVDFIDTVIAAINHALRNIAPEAVRLHVCWGNYEGPHDLDVPLADILPSLLEARVGSLVLPFANPRHAHEYRQLGNGRFPRERTLVAGVIDTTTNYVEHPETVADRIERIALALGDPGRLIAGTDCGFDTAAGMGRVAEDVVWAKLAALSEGARLASERLF